MPYETPPYLASLTLSEIADLVAQRKLPPIEGWAPQVVGDSAMRIAADGAWYHEGGLIRREAMVRAFAGLLKRDVGDGEDGGGGNGDGGGQHWLVTPFEKLTIAVEDAAFIAVDCVRADDALVFRLNTDDIVIAGPDHRLRAAGDGETPALYLDVRRGCEARLNRSTYAQLAEIALTEGADANGWQVSSQGATFALLP